jgi:adenylate kinase
MEAIVNQGKLLPDALILRVIREHFFKTAADANGAAFLLDGFPRTVPQAEALGQFADVQLALDMGLREEVSVPQRSGALHGTARQQVQLQQPALPLVNTTAKR